MGFTILDERGTFEHEESFVYGAPRVEIYLVAATDAGRSRLRFFRGNLEQASNVGAYCPEVSIRASSLSRQWGDRGVNQGFLQVPAWSGLTWGELIQLYAASTCVPLTDFRGELGDEVYSSFDVSGMSLVDLIQQWAPLIGIYLRETDGTLELVPERYVVGPLASPSYAFTPANYQSIREDVPSRPITALTVSAVIPAPEASLELPATTVDTVRVIAEDGSVTETVTTTEWSRVVIDTVWSGSAWVPVSEVRCTVTEEVSGSVAPVGYPAGDAGWGGWGLQQRTITVTAYPATTVTVDGTASTVAAGQIKYVSQKLWKWYGLYSSVASGYLWSDDSHRATEYCAWKLVSSSLTTYSYTAPDGETDDCKLVGTTFVREAYGSRRDPNGEVWDDGVHRKGIGVGGTGSMEAWAEIERKVETWWDSGNDTNQPFSTSHTLEHWAYVLVGSETVGGEDRPKDGYVVDHREAEYRVSLGATRYSELTVNDGTSKQITVEGTIPSTPTAGASTPAYSERAIVVTGASMRNIYPLTRGSESSQDAQRESEVYRLIRRKLREQLAVRYTIAHPIVPLLRVFDAVTVTDPARQLVEKKGYVTAIRRTINLSTGWSAQETTVAMTPPELDPVWP